ncbi:MAG: low molecular weight phosphatase family protein [Nanoarchaeota archaeon]
MKILFICKHNRFRSKVAEAIFNKLNKNRKIKAESAGILIDELHLYVAESVIKIMKEKGYDIGGIPRKVDSSLINNYDLLVIVANNVNPEFFKESFKGKIIWWKIKDCSALDINGIRKRINEIEKRVKKLIRELNILVM